jgi:hypothetical protein
MHRPGPDTRQSARRDALSLANRELMRLKREDDRRTAAVQGKPGNVAIQAHESCEVFCECLMQERHERKWNMETLTDEEISPAIRYLDLDSSCASKAEDNALTAAICSSLLLLIGYTVLICLSRQTF